MQRRSTVVIRRESCRVMVDDCGAVLGVRMPDGTEIPGVMAVDLSASTGELQTALVKLPVEIETRPTGYPFRLDELERQAKASIDAMYEAALDRLQANGAA